ncbi:MAG: AsmA family protein [Gammaproteobacteria bacterium]|nr:AsmA family protein [Gammaproteobacteria bacterium]
MKTFFKLMAGLIVIVIIALAGFIFTFDANQYKTEITDQLESATGRQINIAGDLDISLYPWIGIKVNDVTVSNNEAFSNKAFLTVGQCDVRVKILPLLQKRLEIERLVLNRLSLNLEKNTAGEKNWAGLIGKSGSHQAGKGSGLAGLAIGGIDLKEASLRWLDRSTGKEYKITRLSMSADAVNNNQLLPVALKAFVESGHPEWMAAVNAKAKLAFDENTAMVDARDLKLTAKALLPNSGIDSIKIAMIADSTINLENSRASLSNARISLLGLVISGDVDIEDIFSFPRIHGPVKVKAFEAGQLAANLGFEMPQLANRSSLKSISLTANLYSDFDTLKLDNIAANLDQSKVKGFVHLENADKSLVRFDLEADRLNLDKYRLVSQPALSENKPIWLEVIRTIGLEGEVAIETANVDGIELKQLNVTTSIEDAVVNVNPISMRLHEGEVLAAIQIDAQESPALSLAAEARQVASESSINPLLQNILGGDALKLSGPVDVDIDLNAAGSGVAEWKTSARGTIKAWMTKGEIGGIDFNYASQSVVVDYSDRNDFRVSRTFNDEYVPDSITEFNNLSATFKVENGKLVNKDFLMISEPVNVTGSGSIDYVQRKLDYRPVIDMNVKNTGNIRDKLRDHPMEYHAHGLFGNVACDFNVEKYDLHLGRLMIQEAKANRNKRINRQTQGTWTNVLSK